MLITPLTRLIHSNNPLQISSNPSQDERKLKIFCMYNQKEFNN